MLNSVFQLKYYQFTYFKMHKYVVESGINWMQSYWAFWKIECWWEKIIIKLHWHAFGVQIQFKCADCMFQNVNPSFPVWQRDSQNYINCRNAWSDLRNNGNYVYCTHQYLLSILERADLKMGEYAMKCNLNSDNISWNDKIHVSIAK